MFNDKFEIDSVKVEKLFNDTSDPSLLEVTKSKFLEGDLTQIVMF